MMQNDMRDRLIELIGHIVVPYFTERIADHLIANGVNNIHIYAMNKPDVASEILSNISEIIK